MNRKHRAAGRILFEHLESRCVLAGNVTAELIDGSLHLTGDVLGNGIAITGTETPGEVRVSGTPATVHDQTLINGQAVSFIFLVTNDIVINTGDGNDGIEVAKVVLAGNLTIDAGDGVDYVGVGSSRSASGQDWSAPVPWPPAGEIVPGQLITSPSPPYGPLAIMPPEPFYTPLHHSPGHVQIIGELRVETGDGSDNVFVGGTSVGADVYVRTGGSNDFFVVRIVGARNLDLGMARGADLVNIAVLATRGTMTLETGFDNDIVSLVNSHARGATALLGSDGHNHFAVSGCLFDGTLYGAFGDQSDRMIIRHSVMNGSATFIMRGGFDRLDVDFSLGKFFSTNTGSGSDLVCVRGSALDNIFAALGDGDDQMWMVGSAINQPILSDGGAGADTIHHRNCRMRLSGIINFEAVLEGWLAGLDA
jgi:hypothetical protein